MSTVRADLNKAIDHFIETANGKSFVGSEAWHDLGTDELLHVAQRAASQLLRLERLESRR